MDRSLAEPASAVANCNIRRGAATGGGGGERAAAVTEVADGPDLFADSGQHPAAGRSRCSAPS